MLSWIMRNCITIHWQWMYPRVAVTRMVGLIRSGLVSLDHDDVTTFSLDDANAAVAHAAANAGPFNKTVICP
jgi:alcohol dehydrogenase